MLTFEQSMIVSKILDVIGLDDLIENLESKLTNLKNKLDKELLQIDKNDKEKLKKFEEKMQREQGQILMIICIQYFVSKAYKAKDDLYILVAEIKNIKVEEVKKLSIKECFIILKDSIMEVLPDIVSDKINSMDLKKTL